jgi:DNA-directed RNA polymerase subunit M/transcription elongation factor TFIIS
MFNALLALRLRLRRLANESHIHPRDAWIFQRQQRRFAGGNQSMIAQPQTDTNGFEELFRINCGQCGQSSPLVDWQRTLFGDLAPNQFQCPKCGYAFQRTYHAPKDRNPVTYGRGNHTFVCVPTGFITLDKIQPVLR